MGTSVLVCPVCEVALARRAADCPSCGAGADVLRRQPVEPAVTGGQLAAAATVAVGLVPFLLAVDRAALWLLTTSGTH